MLHSWLHLFASFQKFREYLEGSNLISKLQAKHDILKKALAEGKTLCFITDMKMSALSTQFKALKEHLEPGREN